MTVLTLACVDADADTQAAVLRFDDMHKDVPIKVVSCAQYGAAAYGELRERLQLDLSTGILQADILVGSNYPIPLLDLYMTGDVLPEDIAPCVKNAYEVDGHLYELGPSTAAWAAGEVTGEMQVVPGGEDLYASGKLKLYNNENGSGCSYWYVRDIMKIAKEFSTNDVTLIGYPLPGSVAGGGTKPCTALSGRKQISKQKEPGVLPLVLLHKLDPFEITRNCAV